MSSSTGPAAFERLRSEKIRLIQSGYNKGTIRSDIRSLVVSMSARRHRLISIDYITTLRCHGRGCGFEPRRSRRLTRLRLFEYKSRLNLQSNRREVDGRWICPNLPRTIRMARHHNPTELIAGLGSMQPKW